AAMPAPSLVDSCTKACIKNIRSLIDVGSFEYWQIRTVLQRVESPEQLHQIELNSPQLLGEDAELWQSFISRHIPNWRTKNYRPKNPKKWYEVYCKYKKEQQEEIARDEEILRNSMMGLKAARETNVSKIVDLKMLPKLPKDPRMIANNGGVPIKKGFKKETPSTLNWTSGSKTKMTDGKSVLVRARREAKEISQMGKLAKPTHRLSGPLGQVRKAPEGMVKEYKTAAQPAIKILSKRKPHPASSNFSGGITGPSLEEREKRLKAAMAGGAGSKRDASNDVKHTYVGSSDDDLQDFIEDDEDLDDLFDEATKPKSRPVSTSTSSK
ncbi:putative Elongin-A, partial [Cadophora sp. MPI-SDFR-AT-0126]